MKKVKVVKKDDLKPIENYEQTQQREDEMKSTEQEIGQRVANQINTQLQ